MKIHAPLLLVETKQLANRTVTAYSAIKTDLTNAGARWVNKAVVLDHHLTTSRGLNSVSPFNRAIIKLLVKTNEIKHHKISKKIMNILQKPFIDN